MEAYIFKFIAPLKYLGTYLFYMVKTNKNNGNKTPLFIYWCWVVYFNTKIKIQTLWYKQLAGRLIETIFRQKAQSLKADTTERQDHKQMTSSRKKVILWINALVRIYAKIKYYQ